MLLLVTERTAIFRDFAVRFHQHGIYAYICHYEIARFFCERKDIGGVILDCIPNIEQEEALCRCLRAEYPDMPIAALVPQNSLPDMPACRLIRTDTDFGSERLFSEMLDFCMLQCGWNAETLSTFALTVTSNPKETVYMGYRMPLSVKQHTILRCLFYRAPIPISTDDLMALCYPNGMESIKNLAIQIQRINECAARIDPRRLIVNTRGVGYRLRDGIL